MTSPCLRRLCVHSFRRQPSLTRLSRLSLSSFIRTRLIIATSRHEQGPFLLRHRQEVQGCDGIHIIDFDPQSRSARALRADVSRSAEPGQNIPYLSRFCSYLKNKYPDALPLHFLTALCVPADILGGFNYATKVSVAPSVPDLGVSRRCVRFCAISRSTCTFIQP